MIMDFTSDAGLLQHVGPVKAISLREASRKRVSAIDIMMRLRSAKSRQRHSLRTISLYPNASEKITYAQILHRAMRRVAENPYAKVDVSAEIAEAWKEVGRAMHEGLKTEIKKADENGKQR